ncbi:MAG: Secretion system C-terminal sorting domain, partial [Bacteroidota bacterium]
SFDDGSRVVATGGGFVVRNSLFGPGSTGSALKGHNLTLPSAVHQTTFSYTNEAVFDDSNVDLSLRMCTFNGNQIGVQKIGGRLNLRCNSFSNSDWYAVIAGQYCWLNMSSNHAAGYNHFSGNTVNVLLEEASAIDLAKGYNTLADFTDMNLQGKLAGRYCQSGSGAIVTLDASRNAWTSGSSPVAPNLAYIDLSTWNGCEILLTDNSPQTPSACGQFDTGVIHPVKSLSTQPVSMISDKEVSMFRDGEEDPGEPIIYSQDIDGLNLSEALSLAASHCTAWNEDGDDEMAVNLFHQILTHPLDRSNPEVRWKSKWGHRYMKIALESLYQSGYLSVADSSDSFGYPAGLYVDVLNAMTDTLITDSTYTDQFYLEMDKAQFFRLTGNLDMCEQLLLATDNCQLDSLEQAHLNFWLGRVQQEISMLEDLEDHIQNTETYAVDSTAFVDALSFVSNQYYFGAWIYGPNEVSYAVCGEGGFKNEATASELQLYPNPSTGLVWLSVPEAGEHALELLDNKGKAIMLQNVYLDEGWFTYRLPDSLANGTYLIRVLSPGEVYVSKLVVLR